MYYLVCRREFISFDWFLGFWVENYITINKAQLRCISSLGKHNSHLILPSSPTWLAIVSYLNSSSRHTKPSIPLKQKFFKLAPSYLHSLFPVPDTTKGSVYFFPIKQVWCPLRVSYIFKALKAAYSPKHTLVLPPVTNTLHKCTCSYTYIPLTHMKGVYIFFL
jgi:hypothetical protein